MEKALQIRDTKQSQVALPANIESIPQEIRQLFESLRRLCFVFDDAELPDNPDATNEQIVEKMQLENDKAGGTASWFIQAQKALDKTQIAYENDAETLIDKYSMLVWQPPFQRWKKKIEDIYEQLKTEVDPVPWVREWKNDVELGYRSSYESRIATQEGGRELTEAWICYHHHGNFKAAVTSAMTLLNAGMSSPIVDLAAILVRLCWFRLCHFSSQSQPELYFKSSNKMLIAGHKELINIIRFADWTEEHPVPDTPSLGRLLEEVPITGQDKCVLGLFSGTNNDAQEGAEGDWLVYYCNLLLAIRKNMTVEIKHIAELLQGVIKYVPASPDRHLVKEIMEQHL